MALRGMYQEATAGSVGELEDVLRGYEDVLEKDPVNVPVAKRRVVVLRGLGREQEAVAALVDLLGFSPVDVEAWVELGELYAELGLWDRSVYCLEEGVCIVPNAWNVGCDFVYVM